MIKKSDLLPDSAPLRNKTPSSLSKWGNEYITAATSNNTRRAYQSDIRHFEQSGGRLPASTEAILHYLQKFAGSINSRTLSRRLTALKNWHTYQGFPDPTVHPVVTKTLCGITRTHGKPKEKAPALSPKQLHQIVRHLTGKETRKALRDSALLQIGYFGAFRCSELIAIQCAHLQWHEKGIEILIPHSKTDQTHEGQYCVIPAGNTELCPVAALKKWLEISGIQSGYLFRSTQQNKMLEDKPLSSATVGQILKTCAKHAGIENADKFSSHSLRRGLATSACADGASIPAIMRQGRWKNVSTVMEYIEASLRFEENAATSILNNLCHTEGQ